MAFPYLQVAAFVLPKLVSLITDPRTIKNAQDMKSSVDRLVKSVTGADTPDQAEAKLQDPEVVGQLKVRLAELAGDARRMDAQELAEYNRAANDDTSSARRTLLDLLNRPESLWVSITPSILSYTVVFGFMALVAVLMFGKTQLPSDDKILQILYICVGTTASGFATVLNFWLGSSLGSRRKDGAVALSDTVEKVKELGRPPSGPVGSGPANSSPSGTTPPPAPASPAGGSTAYGGGAAAGGAATRDAPPVVSPLPSGLAGIGRSTDPSTVNCRKDIPADGGLPASMRYNNPGAQYPSREAARFGQMGFGIIGGGHKIATFPSPVNGAASNFDLLARVYVGMAIGAAGQKWTGQNGFGVPGYDPNIILSREMLRDGAQAIPLLKAIAHREAGKDRTLSDEQWRCAHDMFQAGSADVFLARYGRDVTAPVAAVRPDGAPPEQLEVLIAKALERGGYTVDANEGEINIVYVEGLNEDGSPNNDEANAFNDLRCVVGFRGGLPVMLGKWTGTTEPGFYYDRDHPLNRDGAARVKFGQYRAWKVGKHKGTQDALVQVGDVTVCRDLNRDMERTGDREDTGSDFGINQHCGYDLPANDIGRASAGCLVGRTTVGHQQFMQVVRSDPRFVADPGFVFRTTILPAGDVVQ